MLHIGIIVASVYLHDGPSMSQQNKELLKDIADYLKLFGKPFILGGDWQMSPEEMVGSGFPLLLKAQVIAPSQKTYKSGDTSSLIDFFMVSDVLANYAEATCEALVPNNEEERVIPKHSPVKMVLKGTNKSRSVLVASAPPPIPTNPAIGCKITAARPLDWAKAAAVVTSAEAGEATVEQACGAFNSFMEVEVLDAVGQSITNSPALGKRGIEQDLTWKSAFAHVPDKVKAAQTAELLRKLARDLTAWSQMVQLGEYRQAFALWKRMRCIQNRWESSETWKNGEGRKLWTKIPLPFSKIEGRGLLL